MSIIRIIMPVLGIVTLSVSIYALNNDEFAENNMELMGFLLSTIFVLSGISSVKDGRKIEGYFSIGTSLLIFTLMTIGLFV
ncbi:hypothetical protein [Pontibacillus yanchengensis]|uniref:DUF3953 domain-containing protein n=1 Tax=Pontibacillus yanchengensis Y32 TaxID=1385514 RepID=A0A0A2TGM2_9BACI|nr:hypothetical protein [Pontibacillus yanchengensis]KGP74719.1 hypothetical protein N782_00930 [Pontibacillus yanchengensis Y32]